MNSFGAQLTDTRTESLDGSIKLSAPAMPLDTFRGGYDDDRHC